MEEGGGAVIGASAGSHVCEGGGGPGAEVRLSGAGKPLRAGEWCNVRAAGRSRQRTTEHTRVGAQLTRMGSDLLDVVT